MTLSDWRRRIDEIDQKLVELLNERSRCALEIGPTANAKFWKMPSAQIRGRCRTPRSAAYSSASSTKRAPPNARLCIPATRR